MEVKAGIAGGKTEGLGNTDTMARALFRITVGDSLGRVVEVQHDKLPNHNLIRGTIRVFME